MVEINIWRIKSIYIIYYGKENIEVGGLSRLFDVGNQKNTHEYI